MRFGDVVRGLAAVGSAWRASRRGAARGGLVERSGGGWSSFQDFFIRGFDRVLPRSVERIDRPIAQNPTVYRAITVKAEAVGQLPVEVWRRGADAATDEPVKNHWLEGLLKRSSPVTRGSQFAESVVMSLEATGECFAWHLGMGRDAASGVSYPHELWLLPPEEMTAKTGVNERDVVAWLWNRGGRQVTIPVEEVTFWHYPNPYDPVRGLSKLGAVVLEYSGDHAAAVYNRASLQNGAVPPIIFTSDKAWDDEDRQAFMVSLEAKLGGPSRAYKGAALPHDVKATVVSQTRRDMEFLEQRKFSREQTLMVFGVPPAMAGVFDGGGLAGGASWGEQRGIFWSNLMPLITYVQSVLTVDLLQRYDPGFEFFFQVEQVLASLMADEYGKKVETASKLFAMGHAPADINDRLGLGMPTAGRPWLAEGYLPFSVVPARSLAAGGDEDEEVVDPVPDGGEEEAEAGSKALVSLRGAIALARWKDVRAAKQRETAELWADVARSFNRKLRSWLWTLRSETLRNLARVGERATVSGVVRKALGPGDVDDVLFATEGAAAGLVSLSQAEWRKAAERGTEFLGRQTGLAVAFDFLDPAVVAFFGAKAIKVVDVSNGVRERIRAAVTDGINAGEPVRDIAARIREAFDTERARSLTIARTETAQAFNGGHYLAMKKIGLPFHEWLSSQDGLVRDSHISLDGEVRSVGESFSNGVLFPGDPSGRPEEIINCRCVTVPLASRDAEGEG